MGCFSKFRVITFNVLFLCKLIKLSSLQIIIRINKCEFICKFSFQKSFVITFVWDEWVSWDWDLERSGHEIIIRCVTVCCPGVNHPEIGIVIESESLLTASLHSHHCLSRAPSPHHVWGRWTWGLLTRHTGQILSRDQDIGNILFPPTDSVGAGFNWNLNDH